MNSTESGLWVIIDALKNLNFSGTKEKICSFLSLYSATIFVVRSLLGLIFELDHDLLALDTLSCLNQDGLDGAHTLGVQQVLHLHGLHNGELLSLRDHIAGLHRHADHVSGHRGEDELGLVDLWLLLHVPGELLLLLVPHSHRVLSRKKNEHAQTQTNRARFSPQRREFGDKHCVAHLRAVQLDHKALGQRVEVLEEEGLSVNGQVNQVAENGPAGLELDGLVLVLDLQNGPDKNTQRHAGRRRCGEKKENGNNDKK